MAISLIGTPQEGNANNGNNVTLTFDTSPQEGDVVILLSGSANGEFNTVSGYTSVATAETGSAHGTLEIFYKVMGSSPDSGVTITGSGSNFVDTTGITFVLRGVDTAHPFDTTETYANGSGVVPDPASITTITNNAWVFATCVISGVHTTWGTISGYSNQYDVDGNDTFDHTIGIATKEVTTAGAEDPGTWSGLSASDWDTITLAIRPANDFPSASIPTVTNFASSVTSMAVTMPDQVISGDLLIAFSHLRNSGTWTEPTDWTELDAQLGGGSVGELTVHYKISDGSEGATETWTAGTGSTATWLVIKVANWDGTSAPEVSKTSGDVSAADPPSLTPSWGSADTLWIAAAGHSAATNAAWSAGPSGYSDFTISGVSAGGASTSLATATLQTTASSEDPGAYTVSGSNRWWAAMTVGVEPAGGAAVNTRRYSFTLTGVG